MSLETTAPATGAERRAWVRYPCNLDTLYQPGEGLLEHRWWFAKVRDISTKGIGLILRRRFEPGTLLAIALHTSNENLSRTLGIRVVHVSPHPGGGWTIGCTFNADLTDDELHACWSEQRLARVVDNVTPPTDD